MVNARRTSSDSAGPLLKWAGGKRQLLPQLRRFYPAEFGRYIEPFLGSGAVFFDLQRGGRLRGREAILIDSNTDLMGCYETIRDQPDEVGRALDELATGHRHGSRDHYYEVRDRRFNPVRERRRRPDGGIAYTPELAAMFIYLNRTGFNGLFRLNASGAFNVPAGRYHRPNIPDRATLARVADALSGPGVRLQLGSFDLAEAAATTGDFLYIDPPYAPISATANFTSYTPARFDAAAQQRLQSMVIGLATRGCHILLSNSTAPQITALYAVNRESSAAGLRALRVRARRAINSNGDKRGPVDEYLITNISDPGKALRSRGLSDGSNR